MSLSSSLQSVSWFKHNQEKEKKGGNKEKSTSQQLKQYEPDQIWYGS